eukprot:TRINITY_DN13669_c0_g1_i1.p1 TRINITY_DN13669_c0_g1~~TRINITY_DN13669_c0_g1_i1.p1  ORF type:complete len:378 (+),score=66.89 TRINITY_DN13669_c0_g1_i1:136-1269(+)
MGNKTTSSKKNRKIKSLSRSSSVSSPTTTTTEELIPSPPLTTEVSNTSVVEETPPPEPVEPTTTEKGVWEYQNAEGEWSIYDKQTSRLLEGTAHKGLPFITLNFGVWAKSKGGYVVDFTKMTQTEKSSGNSVSVRRNPPLKVQASPKVIKVLKEQESPSGFADPGNSLVKIVSKLTKWKEIISPPEGNCTICMDSLDSDEPVVKLSQCADHYYHKNCIVHCYKNGFLVCPNCGKTYGVRVGTQPEGTMNVINHVPGAVPLAGYPISIGTIQINYNFPNGTQGPEHPNPGQMYEGTSRTGYLPDNDDGRQILKLLKMAWDRKLTFRIGTSVTTGKENQVIWNGIHHKTATTGGFQAFGYPDETYFERVKQELADLGVQ